MSHECLATLWEYNKTNNRNNDKTIAAYDSCYTSATNRGHLKNIKIKMKINTPLPNYLIEIKNLAITIILIKLFDERSSISYLRRQ